LFDAVKQFGAAVKATIDDMGDIADGAAKLGDSAEMFQGLRAAAEQCGVAIDDVSGASNKLQLQLGKIQSGGGKEANDALAKLHITLGDLKGLSPGEAFIKAAGALGEVGDKSQQAAIGAALFGKSWASLKPLIADGAKGLARRRG
jgi:hypothetical protein